VTVIVLEGPDGAGKSTLARRIIEHDALLTRRRHLMHRGPIRSDALTEYLRPLNEVVDDAQNGVDSVFVFDRWHVGELIYGPILRGRSRLTDVQAVYIEMVLQSLGCCFLHVSQPIHALEARWEIEPDDLIKKEQLREIANKYWEYTFWHDHWATISPTEDSPIPFSLETVVATRTPAPLPGRYVGPKRPKVLLLGDARAANGLHWSWPFVPQGHLSGDWLIEAMITGGVQYMRVGLVNACELTTHDLYKLWQDLEWPAVISLGRNAEKAWKRLSVNTGIRIHHPQYMKRFHSGDKEAYGKIIKEQMRG
jgi:hypothetical protein